MIIDILIILVLFFLITRKEHFALDLVINPYERGITQDLQQRQMESVFDSMKDKYIDLDNFEEVSDSAEFLKLSEKLKKKSKKVENAQYSPSLISKLIKLISKKSSVFVDTDLNFLKNQKSINFISENSVFLPIQNSNDYSFIDSKLLEKKELEDTNSENDKLIIKIKRPMAVTYFKINIDFDLFNNNIFKLNDFKIEKKDNYSLSQKVAYNNIDANCFRNCKHKKTQLGSSVFEKNQEYRQIKELDSYNYNCTTKDTNDPIKCASAEVVNNEIIDAGKLFRSKCISDRQCYFYKLNKNYPNNRGGCINGQCELPIGIVPTSAVTFDINSKPMCHSRTGRMEECYEQENDEILKTPDYAFENDFNERLVYEKNLNKKGLQVQNLFPQF